MEGRKKIIVFNGIHSAGKSDLGKKLDERLPGFRYFGEVGLEIRMEGELLVADPGVDFDRQILKRESERDAEILACKETPVIETWHIGNTAYAMGRTPEVVPLFNERLGEMLKVVQPLAIFLEISHDTYQERKSPRHDDEEFYMRLIANTKKVYRDFGIEYVVVNNDGDIEKTFGEIAAKLKERGFITELVKEK